MSQPLIDKAIAEARSGNRLLARMHFESLAEGDNPHPAVWLWLAWVAESPAKAQEYLAKLDGAGAYAEVGRAAMLWTDLLVDPDSPLATFNAEEELRLWVTVAPQKLNVGTLYYEAKCPNCQVSLSVKSSALGKERECPGCHQVIRIPSTGRPLPGPAVSASASEQRESHPPDAHAPLILVVDDSVSVCTVMERVLNKHGYRSLSVQSGEKAYEAIEVEVPALIFLDIGLPGVDGYTVCRKLRELPKTRDVPIVMLSGKGAFFDKLQGTLAGATKYISKPTASQVIIETVNSILPRSSVVA